MADDDDDKPPADDPPKAPAPSPPTARRRFGSSFFHHLLVPLLGFALIIGAVAGVAYVDRDVGLDRASVAREPLTREDEALLGAALAQAWAGQVVEPDALPYRLREPGQPIYIAFRADGERLHQLWRTPAPDRGASMWDVLIDGLAAGREKLGDRVDEVTHVEIDLTHSYRRVAPEKFDYAKKMPRSQRPKRLYDFDEHGVSAHTGVRGFQFTHGDRVGRWAPTWFLAKNRELRDQLEKIRKDWGLSAEQMAQATYEVFEADQILVDLSSDPIAAHVMFRGNRIVTPEEVTAKTSDALVTGMASWLINNVDEDGRLTYYYFPSTASEAGDNNMIRQWMATNAMIRWAHDREDQAVFDLVERNIDYNLEHFFHYERDGEVVTFGPGETPPDDVLGVIEYRGKSKLGAIGLTGMALWLHPKRDKWRHQIDALLRTIDQLQKPSGSFTSFYRGGPKTAAKDKKFHHYYPGEAMLFWAVVYAETKDPSLLAKFKRSFGFYREWHLHPDNRNPAFVPWHLQADWTMWSALGADEQEFRDDLARFMFETADWLIESMQDEQWVDYVHPDERGRFYTRTRSFGKPHASATGVYIEGIIDAWQLARAIGQNDRRERYRVALVRAARSMMQLQFVDEVDMFYVRDPEAVQGGIRTTLYDNRIRCDNVQHPMMGLIKMVRMFEADEYADADAPSPTHGCTSTAPEGGALLGLALLGLASFQRRRRAGILGYGQARRSDL